MHKSTALMADFSGRWRMQKLRSRITEQRDIVTNNDTILRRQLLKDLLTNCFSHLLALILT